jgi:hypothetical protein
MWNFFKRTSLYILAIPVLFTFLGAASNQLVLIVNGDTFPVLLNAKKVDAATAPPELKFPAPVSRPQPAMETSDGTIMLDDVHCVMTSQTHLNALADVFDLGNIYSIGDFGLILGEYLWAFAPFLFAFDVARKLMKVE